MGWREMTINEDIAGFCARVQDIAARSAAIKEDATSLCVDVASYAGNLERTLPPSDMRDQIIGALGSLTGGLATLGALPPADISALPRKAGHEHGGGTES